ICSFYQTLGGTFKLIGLQTYQAPTFQMTSCGFNIFKQVYLHAYLRFPLAIIDAAESASQSSEHPLIANAFWMIMSEEPSACCCVVSAVVDEILGQRIRAVPLNVNLAVMKIKNVSIRHVARRTMFFSTLEDSSR
ncbi:hypothetical protein PTI98_004251, partial [Pleurotus ostreatus]